MRPSISVAVGSLSWVVLAVAVLTQAQAQGANEETGGAPSWRQWGGPNRDFTVETAGLAEQWPAEGPPVLFSRSLGNGHSTILVDEGLLYTMYRVGDPGKAGPWVSEETVVALDAETGATAWEFAYPSKVQDFGRGAGPHSTPLIAGDRLFAIGTNKQLHALDKKSGELLWSRDFVADLGAPPLDVRPIIKSGYASSPLAIGDLLICYVGGPGQSVVAFRQSDGEVVWSSGHFLIGGGSPRLVEVDGEQQLVIFAGSLVAGLDPQNGEVLWVRAHDAGNDFNFSPPLWSSDDQILFLSSAYRAGSRALQLSRENGLTSARELWFDNRVKFQFLNGVRVGEYVYGTTGQSGTAFLTAVHVPTGESAWRERSFGQSTLVHADDKLIVLTEDGELALTRATPESLTVLARHQLFDTTSWSAPTLVGTVLYARDREKLVALELGAP